MVPMLPFTGKVHRLPDAPEAYGTMITHAKSAPPQSHSNDLSALITEARSKRDLR